MSMEDGSVVDPSVPRTPPSLQTKLKSTHKNAIMINKSSNSAPRFINALHVPK